MGSPSNHRADTRHICDRNTPNIRYFPPIHKQVKEKETPVEIEGCQLQWKRLCVPAQKHIWSKHVKVTNKCHLSNGSHLDFYQQFLCPPKILIKCLWEFLENSENAKCICKEARSWSENKLKLFWRLNDTKSAIQITLKDIWISASRCWTEH